MTTDLLKITDQMIESWNSHDSEKFLALCDEGIVWSTNNVPTETFRGKTEVRDFYNNWKRAFPDLKIKIRNRIASQDQVSLEYEFTGTQKGALRTRKDIPEFPVSNKSTTVYSCLVATIKNGKLTQVNNYPDRFTLLDRLGLLAEMYHTA